MVKGNPAYAYQNLWLR